MNRFSSLLRSVPINPVFLLMLMASGLAAGILLIADPASAKAKWFDESSIRGYEYTGPYAQLGVSIGRIDFDDRGFQDVDNDASGGFTLTGGYRVLPWLAAEGNFTFLGGEQNVEVGNIDRDSHFFAFTFGPKVYPLGAFETDAIPHFVQPYGLVQIGGGEIEVAGSRNAGFDKSTFVARFLLGFDLWASDHVGFFVEGGGHVIEDGRADGAGIFTVGVQYRF
jgi:hypothetical protein